MIQPNQTKCGDRFCYSCATYYFDKNLNRCPGCLESVDSIENHLIIDKAIEKEIINLNIKCINGNCKEILIFKDLKKHLLICKYQDEKCDKCFEFYPIGTKFQHLNENCKNVLISCKDCGKEYLREFMETIHKNLTKIDLSNLCEKWIIDCPNRCQLDFTVNNIKQHLEICPKQPILCIMSNIGCKSIVIRDEMDNHIKDNLQSHFLLLNENRNEFVSKTVTYRNSENENIELKKINENLRYECNLLKNKNKLLITELEKFKNNVSICENNININENGTLIWIITNIMEKIKLAKSDKDIIIYSDEFYTAHPGYKMKLKAFPNGDGLGKGEHFSLYFVIMKGDYDDLISWPFKKIVTFSIESDNKSTPIIQITMKPDDNSNCYGKPINQYNLGAGQPKFLKHDELMLKSKIFLKTLSIRMTVHD